MTSSEQSNLNTTVDVLIIGGSYAGLSAALTLYRALHSCIIFDSKTPRNHYSTPVRLTLTWEHRSYEDVLEAARTELLQTGLVKFVSSGIETARKREDGCFELLDDGGTCWVGRKVLFATGAQDVFPNVEGYDSLYAKLIFPCMFQFGYELRGSASAGLLAVDGLANVFQATVLAQDGFKFVDKMTIYTNANSDLATQLSNAAMTPGLFIDDRKIKRLRSGKSSSEISIDFEDGSSKSEAFLVHRPLNKIDSRLSDQVGIQISKMGVIDAAPPFCKTNVPGIFAAGDCASFAKSIPTSLSMGAYAGCGIARELPKTCKVSAI